jgi:hypothetical protein
MLNMAEKVRISLLFSIFHMSFNRTISVSLPGNIEKNGKSHMKSRFLFYFRIPAQMIFLVKKCM